jgi:hypothetical protein
MPKRKKLPYPKVRFFKSKKSAQKVVKPKDNEEITEKDFLNKSASEEQEIETGDQAAPVQITNVNVTIAQDEDSGIGCGSFLEKLLSCCRP